MNTIEFTNGANSVIFDLFDFFTVDEALEAAAEKLCCSIEDLKIANIQMNKFTVEEPKACREPELEILIDFANAEEADQDLVLAYLMLDEANPLTTNQFDDFYSMKKEAEALLVGKTKNFQTWLFEMFLETNPGAREFRKFLNVEICADEIADYYKESNGFVFLQN